MGWPPKTSGSTNREAAHRVVVSAPDGTSFTSGAKRYNAGSLQVSGCPPGAEQRLVVGANCLGTLGVADQGKSAPLAHSLGRSCLTQHLRLGRPIDAERRAIVASVRRGGEAGLSQAGPTTASGIEALSGYKDPNQS